MPIYNNSPTFTYIRVDGASVVYDKEVYMVARMYTNQKYIYWDFNTPYQFVTSNVRLEESSTRFLVLINDKGVHTEVPQETISISFDANSDEAIRNRIYGIYEKNEEFEDKFVAVEMDIDGIKSIVGESEEDEGTLLYKMSKMEQRADKIELSVEEVTKEFNTSVEMTKLREEVNGAFVKLNSDLALFKSGTTTWFKDNEIKSDEKTEIQASIDVLVSSKSKLYSEIDKVLNLETVKNDKTTSTGIKTGKTNLDTSHDNLVKIINNAIADSTIVPSERTLVTNAFAQYTLKINELKNVIDDAIILGFGAKVVEELSKIEMKSDEIQLLVQKVEKEGGEALSTAMAEIKLTTDAITSSVQKVEKDAQDNHKIAMSKIEQTAESLTSSIEAVKKDAQGNLDSATSKITQTVNSIQTQVTAQNTRLGKAESTITQHANQIATKVDVNGVKSTIQQNPESVRIAFSGINDNIDFDHQGIKIWHPSGKHTRISSDGLKVVSNSNGNILGDYHYLTHVVGFTTTAETETYKWVQLPDDFKGKNFRAYATLSDTWEGSWDWGEPWVIQRMVVFVADYDRANARVAIQGYRTDKNYKTGAHRHKPVAGMLIIIA